MSSPAYRQVSARDKNAKTRLVLFHHAGGSSLSFGRWLPLVPDSAEVLLAELPGRGTRSREPLLTTFDEACAHLTSELETYRDLPLIFFGHSLGALFAFEVAQNFSTRVKHIGISSFLPPAQGEGSNRTRLSDLEEAEFLKRLQDFALLPSDLLENPAALAYFVPILRADMRLAESYHARGPKRPDLSLSLFSGSRDIKTPPTDVEKWKTFGRVVSHKTFDGGHFQALQNPDDVLGSLFTDADL